MRIRDGVLLSVILLSTVGCDQISKQTAIRWLSGGPSTSYLGDTFRLTYMENTGAFLGLGSDWPEGTRWFVFTLLSSVFVAGALWIALHGIRRAASLRQWGPHIGPLLVAAGGIGNLIDRFMRDGAVVDFMNMGIGGLRTGIFNVADVYIMVGLGLWLVSSRRDISESPA